MYTSNTPQILPRRLLAGSRELPPSETIHMAAIGCGGRACSDILGLEKAGVSFVAFCDVDDSRAASMRMHHPGMPYFHDYREMLDRFDRDIDAVLIATPDHLHTTMALECLRREKHIQCEKPLTQCHAELDALLAETARHPHLVTQAMNQGHAYDTLRDFREWIEAGLIGDVSEAHVWCPAVYSFMDHLDELKRAWPIPTGLDWERWQGPVPHRPYCPKFLPGSWRFWTDYGTNTLGDWSCHLMDPLFWTFGLGMPLSVKAEIVGSWDPSLHGATFPKGVKTTFEYLQRNGKPFRLVWYDGLACQQVPIPENYPLEGSSTDLFPPYNTDLLRSRRDGMANGALIYGSRGVIEYGHHGANYLRILPTITLETLRAQGSCPPQKYPRVPGNHPDEKPFNEFASAIKGRGTVGSDFAYAGAMTACALTGVAAIFDPGKTLLWDNEKRLFSNSAAANQRLHLPRLSGW